MRVTVVFAVVELLHQLGGRVAQVQRHRPGTVLFDKRFGGVESFVDRIGFGRHRQVNHAFRQRQLTLRRAQALINLSGVKRQAQRARIGQADVFRRHADQAARHVLGLGPAVEHSHQPVQRRIRVGAAHAFVQRRDRVVKLLAALVVAAHLLAQHGQQPSVGNQRQRRA